MCGRFVLIQKLEAIEKRFNVTAAFDIPLEPNYNITPGTYTPVVASDNPKALQMMRFGMTPFWSKVDKFLINARAEGDHNPEDNPSYRGAKGIIEKPAFRKPIRSQRCLVIADAFIEGTVKERLGKPFLIYLRNKVRPFAMAGIWDEWQEPSTGKVIRSFAIITTVANDLLRMLPHHRMPVILHPSQESRWLNPETPLSDITAMLKPFDSALMNAYPLRPEIKSPRAQGRALIEPAGPPLLKEEAYELKSYLRREGMGNSRQHFTDMPPDEPISNF